MTQASLRPSVECPAPELRAGAQGIARVAVDDAKAQLIVTFHRPIVLPEQLYLLNSRSYSLTGGRRLFPRVLTAEIYPAISPPEPDNRSVRLTLDKEGDFSIYTLTVSGPDIDPFFSSHKLRFRLSCDDRFDCRLPAPHPPVAPELSVAIDYLAKDYSSFRQTLLDFVPTRLLTWTERSEADIGMMLLELFASIADTLSYMQDRVANEAFLSTATQRRSVAGHLALVGYELDEGASAHTWLQFQVGDVHLLPGGRGLRVSTRRNTSDEPVIVYETLGEATLDPRHNTMVLHTWGNKDCCVPRQALSAELVGSYEGLKVGDYLLLDDGRGHRDVVRLTSRPEIVRPDGIASPPMGAYTIVRWSEATPLHHEYCAADTSVRGNMVPTTHGETVEDVLSSGDPGLRRLRLRLPSAPLAHLDVDVSRLAAPLVPEVSKTATPFLERVFRSVSTLKIKVDGVLWKQQKSLLESGPHDQVFRVEIDDQGEATVVFGGGTFGQRPPAEARITASYRVGGGRVGNVAADTLVQAYPEEPGWLISVTNPLPAFGGRDLESRDHARRVGPSSIRAPLVAVTATDYQAAVQSFTDAKGQHPFERANAAFEWTGSWLTSKLTADPRGAEALTPDLRRDLLAYLDSRRLAGYDLEITRAEYVPLDLVIEFCVLPGFRAGNVQQGLEGALSNLELPDGRKGFFHPENFSFGDGLYVSELFAAVMAVPGVESAQIMRLARLHAAHPDRDTEINLRQGFLAVGRSEIVQLDNDRNFPGHGVLTLRPKGSAQ